MSKMGKQSPECGSPSVNSGQDSFQHPISLLNDPEQFTKMFLEFANRYFQQEYQDLEEGLECLNKLYDLLDLGKNILHDVYPYWKVCLDINLASISQKLNEGYKCLTHCQSAEAMAKEIMAENFEQSDIFLHFSKELIKVNFQRCGVLSLSGQHFQSQEACHEIFGFLEKYLERLLKIAHEQNSLSACLPKKQLIVEPEWFQASSLNTAEQIIKTLLIELKKPVKKRELQSPFYYWVHNPDNNSQQVKKMFMNSKQNENWKRSVLGVNKKNSKIESINVGKIMRIEERSIKDFLLITNAKQHLFKEEIYQTVFYVSLAYFVMATELRYTEKTKQKYNPHNAICNRYGYSLKKQETELSQQYHLKSIQIITQSINSEIPYLTHLVDTYKKHYIINKPLDQILSLADESLFSMSYGVTDFDPKFDAKETKNSNTKLEESHKKSQQYFVKVKVEKAKKKVHTGKKQKDKDKEKEKMCGEIKKDRKGKDQKMVEKSKKKAGKIEKAVTLKSMQFSKNN